MVLYGEATGRRTPLCFAQAQAATEAALARFFIGHIHHHIHHHIRHHMRHHITETNEYLV